jgi:DNA-binding NarL/FixJ family response regulator
LFSTIRVLVVDDYEPWMNFVSAVLATSPRFQVVRQAGNGLTALQKAAELKPDLVVLDIGLPGLSGIEVAQKILEWTPDVRILFLTENTVPENSARCHAHRRAGLRRKILCWPGAYGRTGRSPARLLLC